MSASQPDAPARDTRKLRVAAVAAYALGVVVSLAWGLSYDLFYDHGLRAHISGGLTHNGNTFVTVLNASDVTWSDVRIEADETWFIHVDDVPPGEQVDARLQYFESIYRLPRPRGIYLWEDVGGVGGFDYAPARLRPDQVRVTCSEGVAEAEIQF